jgi:hypothetical protein
MLSRLSFTMMTTVRAVAAGFAETFTVIGPSPWPLVGLTEAQAASLAAVHLHSRAARPVRVTRLPAEGTVAGGAETAV